MLAALERTRSCLIGKGLQVAGGPSLGMPSDSPGTPIGELSIANGETPTLIGFFENSRAARQFAPAALHNAKPLGQVERRDKAVILWTARPTSAQRSTAEACAFG